MIYGVSKSFGVPGESARQQAEDRRRRLAELERLERRAENWAGGAEGEQATADAINRHCPNAVVLHDRRMPESRANIDHIVLVPSGVWVIGSKRMKGRISVEDADDGTQKLLVNRKDQTALVHKLTGQVNAVIAALIDLDPHVPVHGAFCFHLPIDSKRGLLNPFAEDSGLPVFRTRTINQYALFYPRQMTRRLNSAGTLSLAHAEELGAQLAARFVAALNPAATASSKPPPRAGKTASAKPPRSGGRSSEMTGPEVPRSTGPARLSKEQFKAKMQAEYAAVWEQQRHGIEEALGGPLPPLLSDRLTTDDAVWCHHALWHARVYQACMHGRVGQSFTYTRAAAVVADLHAGHPAAPQWRALTAFLSCLQAHGYLDFTDADGRIERVAVRADLQHPPT